MKLDDIIRKLSARKLWLAVLLMAMGGFFTSGGEVTELDKILDAACKIFGACSFIFAEGAADAARAKSGNETNETAEFLEDVLLVEKDVQE